MVVRICANPGIGVRHKRNYDLSGDGVELDSNNCKNFMTFFGQKIAKNGQIA